MAATSPALSPLADLLGVVRRWRRPILLTTVAASIVSAGIALRMPNIYPATTTFYATNLETSDPDQLSSGERKIVLLPEPADLDRAVNIGSSQPVADYIIARYHLAAHYHYDTARTPEARQSTRELFQERLSMQVSDRAAVELTFLDTDRDTAAAIANDLVTIIDSVSQHLMQPNRRRVLQLFETKYQLLDQAYTTTRDTLQHLRKRTGLYGLEREDRYLAKAIAETETALRAARAGGGGRAAALQTALDGLLYRRPGSNTLTLESFAANRYRVNRLQSELEAIQGSLVKARDAYETARATLGGRVSNVYVVQPAFPVARKVQPVRWLIVLSSTVAAFVLVTLAALLLEYLRALGGPAVPDDYAPASSRTTASPAAERPRMRA
ncbi:MAG: hypothetical protein H7330_08940 [Hymenobacteraceae bacterium]|nr:hypothetical protein [Hymenobacteraceae bacterium]